MQKKKFSTSLKSHNETMAVTAYQKELALCIVIFLHYIVITNS